MARPDKAAAVAELTDNFRNSAGAVLTEYRGLTVKQLQDLRRALGENVHYAVAKNTLTKIAARDAGVDGVEHLLSGPTAIAFINGDPVEAAKSLRDFARNNEPLVIKGGVLEGRPLAADEISRLADLESREVLLARLAGGMKASLQGAVSLFNAPLAQAARVFGALQAKAADDPSVLAADLSVDSGSSTDAAGGDVAVTTTDAAGGDVAVTTTDDATTTDDVTTDDVASTDVTTDDVPAQAADDVAATAISADAETASPAPADAEGTEG